MGEEQGELTAGRSIWAALFQKGGILFIANIDRLRGQHHVAPRPDRCSRPFGVIAAGLMACTALTTPALAQDAVPSDASEPGAEIVVTGALNALPDKDVGSIFGFAKTLVETPR